MNFASVKINVKSINCLKEKYSYISVKIIFEVI